MYLCVIKFCKQVITKTNSRIFAKLVTNTLYMQVHDTALEMVSFWCRSYSIWLTCGHSSFNHIIAIVDHETTYRQRQRTDLFAGTSNSICSRPDSTCAYDFHYLGLISPHLKSIRQCMKTNFEHRIDKRFRAPTIRSGSVLFASCFVSESAVYLSCERLTLSSPVMSKMLKRESVQGPYWSNNPPFLIF